MAATTEPSDPLPPRPIVVVGGGNAAGYFCRQAAQLGRASDVRVLGGEPWAPYERPALSKAYLAPANPARLPGFHTCVGGGGERQDAGWYAEKGFDLRLGAVVEKIDAVGKTVTWREQGGGVVRTCAFERLVLATGARPVSLAADFKTPGADLPGIFALRDVSDADALLAAVAAAAERTAKDAPNPRPAEVLVVGGGYIGVEACSNLSVHQGIKLTMILPEPSVLARVIPAPLALFYERQLEARGVKILKGRAAVAFEPASADDPKRVGFAVLNAGPEGPARLPCDVVLVGAGARPNVSLAADAGLTLAPTPPLGPGGVQVDGSLRSVSHPCVYVVGDVAAFPLPRLTAAAADKPAAAPLARQEHVAFARASAAYAAQAALSASGEHPSAQPIPYLPYFYSRIYDLGWVCYGEAPTAADGGEIVLFGPDDPATAPAPGKAKFGAYWVAPRGSEGRRCVVGAFLEGGDAAENEGVRLAVARGAPVSDGEGGGVAELARLGAEFAVAYAAKL